mmetsp:Transcript_28676/g.37586  ORF Transcript_28676/g.37586 Transcript_28676/m.37586 type:complete len:313 (-) Transcript_28676:107-1045(-)
MAPASKIKICFFFLFLSGVMIQRAGALSKRSSVEQYFLPSKHVNKKMKLGSSPFSANEIIGLKGISEANLNDLVFLKGGAVETTNNPSPFTLFIQIFIPSYGTTKTSKKKLDPRESGLIGRIKRFFTSLFQSPDSLTPLDTKRTSTSAKKSGGKGSKQNHLNQNYKPGNVNYRIQKELKEFIKNPPPNCAISVGKNIRVWIITITGAENTVYAGEKYKLRVSFPDEYPSKPPSCYFLKPTPRHPHCYTNGDICLSLLGKDWKPNLTVSSLALSILSMLSSAKKKSLPLDNSAHADSQPGKAQDNFIYHDDNC